jgi:hypothetical protein
LEYKISCAEAYSKYGAKLSIFSIKKWLGTYEPEPLSIVSNI